MVRSANTRSPRIRTQIAATLIDSDGGELSVRVLDLSSGGFRLDAGEELVEGEFVRLRVDRYDDYKAQIIWVLGNEAGGRFLEPAPFQEEKASNAENERRVGDRRKDERRQSEPSKPVGGVDRRKNERRKSDRRD